MHSTGIQDNVIPLVRAEKTAWYDELMLEVHNNPAAAKSDGPHALLPG